MSPTEHVSLDFPNSVTLLFIELSNVNLLHCCSQCCHMYLGTHISSTKLTVRTLSCGTFGTVYICIFQGNQEL